MDNLWLLTEERSKPKVVRQIIEMYCNDFNDVLRENGEVKINPCIKNGYFQFVYEVEGLSVANAYKIYIKTVSGNSSFLDFLLFKQENAPVENSHADLPIMGIEETKTSDKESRNTGVSQRISKFIYFKNFYPNTNAYMLYNEEIETDNNRQPSDTNIFGTNILLNLGVKIIGKDISRWFAPFNSVDELIDFKNNMRNPNHTNIPVKITRQGNTLKISGRLEKPKDSGNIGHDPSIGTLSMIAGGLRKLGWTGNIVITRHGVRQNYINRNTTNKFLFNSKILGMKLEGLTMPTVTLPDFYWHYERKSEKMADILLHMQAMYHGVDTVYENHAGCERGYYKRKNGELVALPKKDRNGVNLYLPDLVLYDEPTNNILLIEGKMLSTLQQGLEEIENYDSIENEYIIPDYGNVQITRGLSIFGGNERQLPDEKVIFYLADDGRIIINNNSPDFVKRVFENTGAAVIDYGTVLPES